MRLTVVVKLIPTSEQASALTETVRRATAVCNAIADTAWESCTFGQYALHKLTYAPIRAQTGLAAQVVVRCIAKVADAYKPDRKTKRSFRPMGAIAYDDRILRWFESAVSIWTVGGRQHIPFVCDERTRAFLATRMGESDLLYRDGMWFLYATVAVVEPPGSEPADYLGVDLGVVNLAADSDGSVYSGGQVNGLRKRHAKIRRRLQSKRKHSTSANRLLRKRCRKEGRFAKNVNHCISKALVRAAQGTQRGIALEDLMHIRSRITARKPQRRRLHSWSFGHLRSCIEYKARLAGVSLVCIDPRYTSQTCPVCGCIDRRNRPNQALFLCVQCGFSGLADTVAAKNIRWAAVNQPYAGSDPRLLTCKLPASAGGR
jgi:putative transposase